MKPRNKYEADILAISQKYTPSKPMTTRQKNWAEKNVHERYYTPHYKEVVCLECKHQFKPDPKKLIRPTRDRYADKVKCPCCNSTLKHVGHSLFGYSNSFERTEFFCVYDVCQSFQVERTYCIKKFMVKKESPTYSISEVVQRWIDTDGKLTTIAKKRNSFNYYDSFSLNSDFEIRNPSLAFGFDVYPVTKMTPILERNGFTFKPFIGYRISEAMTEILTKPFFENIVKLGMYDVATKYILSRHDSEKERIEGYKNQFRIIAKKQYKIEDLDDYLDYLDLLVYFGKDINNPVYICPSNLHQSHQRLLKKKAEITERQDKEAKKEKHEQLTVIYQEEKKKYLDITIQAQDIVLTVPKTIDDFYTAGIELKHCIYENEYYSKPTVILFAYVNGKLVEAAEIDPKKKQVLQCRGWQNQPTEHNATIVNLINQNLNLFTKRKRATA